MIRVAFRKDHEGFSFREGFSSNERKILRDQIMVGVTMPGGLSGHTGQVIARRPAGAVWLGSHPPRAPHRGVGGRSVWLRSVGREVAARIKEGRGQ
jgi:hypothetical protein